MPPVSTASSTTPTPKKRIFEAMWTSHATDTQKDKFEQFWQALFKYEPKKSSNSSLKEKAVFQQVRDEFFKAIPKEIPLPGNKKLNLFDLIPEQPPIQYLPLEFYEPLSTLYNNPALVDKDAFPFLKAFFGSQSSYYHRLTKTQSKSIDPTLLENTDFPLLKTIFSAKADPIFFLLNNSLASIHPQATPEYTVTAIQKFLETNDVIGFAKCYFPGDDAGLLDRIHTKNQEFRNRIAENSAGKLHAEDWHSHCACCFFETLIISHKAAEHIVNEFKKCDPYTPNATLQKWLNHLTFGLFNFIYNTFNQYFRPTLQLKQQLVNLAVQDIEHLIKNPFFSMDYDDCNERMAALSKRIEGFSKAQQYIGITGKTADVAEIAALYKGKEFLVNPSKPSEKKILEQHENWQNKTQDDFNKNYTSRLTDKSRAKIKLF